MIFGSDESEGAGLGNLLIFFPAAYYFAAFTERDIIISDNSIIGEVCKLIHCGFPFVSEMAAAFPAILKDNKVQNAISVKAMDFREHLEGKKVISEPVVRAVGYMPNSDWWAYYNTTAHCVMKITGCILGDIGCADRHAFQRLIRGPFRSSLSTREEKRIHGIPNNMKHAILRLPHAYAPRLDAALHLRAQFSHFEHHSDINDPEYKKEVATWLNSTECNSVFQSFENKLIDCLREMKSNHTGNVYVYLAGDNEEVKDALFSKLDHKQFDNITINIMRVDANFIHHVKNLAKMKKATNNEGLLDLVFDWYALTLANVILAWRKGSTHMISTFVHSAQRVSGTTARTDARAPVGGGVGTNGLQLMKDRRGNPRWDQMWSYGFLEDYQ